MSTWPTTLPQVPQVLSFAEQRQDATLRSTMDAGPAKVRRRFTAVPVTWAVAYTLDADQLAALGTFYEQTLDEGSGQFDWPHPRTAATVSARFVGPYRIGAYGNDLFAVTATIEVLP